MKILLLAFAVFAAVFLVQRMLAADFLSPAEGAQRVAGGTAILIDIREPAEWTDGVVRGALLLPLSDLRGDREKWGPALAVNRDKELILYCRSGKRAGFAAEILTKEGFRVANAGGFSTWQQAGQPTAKP